MDKETLSNYGWIVICTLVLAVMIALATPFGGYIRDGIWSVTNGLNDTLNKNMEIVGLNGGGGSGNVDDNQTTGKITTETSENVMMVFYDANAGSFSQKMFAFWATSQSPTKVKFTDNYPATLTFVEDTSKVTADSNNALDISEAQNKGVAAYIVTEGNDTVLYVAGNNGVVMANANSSAVFALMPTIKSIEFGNYFNTTRAQNMEMMFAGGENGNLIETLDLTSFDFSNVTNLSGLFSDCKNLKNLHLPAFKVVEGANIYGMYMNCRSLENVILPEGITSIGDNAFYGCKSLANINIPDNITSIGESAFQDCESLKIVIIPNSVTSIGGYVFCFCESLEEIVLSNSLTSIPTNAFNACASLKYVSIPSSVKSIGTSAFFNCTSLADVVIEEGLVDIGGSAFKNCSKLESLTLPSTVKTIGNYCFEYAGLDNINFKGTMTQWNAINKSTAWDSYSSIDKITCSDGTITL